MRALAVSATVAILIGLATESRADTSKLGKDDVVIEERAALRGKNKLCCGYPLVAELEWALRFYWLAVENDFDEPDEVSYANLDAVDIYNRDGIFMGSFAEKFAWHLRMEGSGVLSDGRVINYQGKCKFGYGTCFETMDMKTHPFGRGAGQRPLVPFKSVAVDPRFIAIGEPVYVPEFDGMRLPDGNVHDGCVRADDTGGGIKKKKMDFFVMTYANFRFLLSELWGVIWITPNIEDPRCEYLRDP